MAGARDHFELGVKGLEGLVANFYAADIDCQLALETATRRAGDEIFGLAYMFCPVDTGFMQEHLKLLLTRFTFEIGWDATDFFDAGHPFYPEWVEFGTRFMPGQYVLTRAYDEGYPKYVADVSQGVHDALERRRAA